MLVDYHIHSHFSLDCKSLVSDVVATCEEKGIKSFIITDHYEVSTKDVWKEWCFDVESYKKEMAKYSLPVGVELGWDGVKPLNLNLESFDFVLLSHHDIDDPIDQESYVKYLERLNKLIRKVKNFHCLAHLDFPRRYQKEHEPFLHDTYNLLEEILKYLIQNGKFLEVNTRSISVYGEPNPSVEILRLYKELGGELLTLGSDAHNLENIGLGLKEGIEILKDIGYNYIMILNESWEALRI